MKWLSVKCENVKSFDCRRQQHHHTMASIRKMCDSASTKLFHHETFKRTNYRTTRKWKHTVHGTATLYFRWYGLNFLCSFFRCSAVPWKESLIKLKATFHKKMKHSFGQLVQPFQFNFNSKQSLCSFCCLASLHYFNSLGALIRCANKSVGTWWITHSHKHSDSYNVTNVVD